MNKAFRSNLWRFKNDYFEK